MPTGDPHAALALVLCHPAAMRDLAAGRWDWLRERLGLDEEQVKILRGISPEALRRYVTLLQRRRLESLAGVFPASMGVLCDRRGFDAVAGHYWDRYPLSSAVPADSINPDSAASWVRYVADQDTSDLPAWLADLARYERMRSRAVLDAAPLPGPWPQIPSGPLHDLVFRLAPGVKLDRFSHDMPSLYQAVRAGQSPVAAPGAQWLLASWASGSGLRELRVGPGAGLLLTACDGHRPLRQALSVAEIAAASPREAAACTLVRRLARERMLLCEPANGSSGTDDGDTGERDHARVVQPRDRCP
jgi:hypothetical protein